jgi:hypothetical protein
MNAPNANDNRFEKTLAEDPSFKEMLDLFCQGSGPRPAPPDPSHFPVRVINLGFRPRSYWSVANLRQLVANIKGAARKKRALELIAQGRLEQASDGICADTLSEAQRLALGRVHPNLMGGEYLPAYLPGEVEIARVTLATIMTDVISVRARPAGKRIRYRMVDDYGSTFVIRPTLSKLPLTLQQLVQLIETAESPELGPVGLRILDNNLEDSLEPAASLLGFMEVTSEFYPDLEAHYWWAIRRWVAENSKPVIA